jgi:drug/metabolite transporter (DMT)-like permease
VLSIALAVVVLTLIWPSDGEQLIAGLSTSAWPLFVVLGVFGAGLSFLLYIKGLRHTTPAVAAIVAMVEPVTAAGFGFVVLNESLTGIQVLGMVLIVGTVTALSTRTKAETGVTE